MNRSQKGFTLIELLVVIGIIGILAAIVIASLSGAKNSGKDSAIKGEFDQARTEIELTANNAGDYGPIYAMTSCPTSSNPPDSVFYTDATVKSIIAKVTSLNGGTTVCAAGTPNGTGNATSWAIESPVKYSNQWWCVSSGNGPKLSVHSTNIFAYLYSFITPTAQAAIQAPQYPNIGGGYGTPASCP